MWWQIECKGIRTGEWIVVLKYSGSKRAWRAALSAQGQGWMLKSRELRVVPAPK